jgi:hypothetical protein
MLYILEKIHLVEQQVHIAEIEMCVIGWGDRDMHTMQLPPRNRQLAITFPRNVGRTHPP